MDDPAVRAAAAVQELEKKVQELELKLKQRDD
jgi:hypothetical protein